MVKFEEITMRIPIFQALAGIFTFLMIVSCATTVDRMNSIYPDSRIAGSSPDILVTQGSGNQEVLYRGDRTLYVANGYVVPNEIQQKIVASGYRLTETHRLVVDGQRFTADCTGTVLAAYWGAGLNPVKYFSLYTGNGVKRLFDMGDDYHLNYLDQMPSPGDVIIWDNTYDKDGDGKWGDQYTHAGIVMAVSDKGQITYMHYNYSKGVVLEQMNLFKPDEYTDKQGTVINSPMRMRSDRHIRPESWLASHLIRAFVPLYLYPEMELES